MSITIKDLVKDNTVSFSHLRQGFAYYMVSFEDKSYQFPVELSDIGDATLMHTDKAIYFMRYINKAKKDGTFCEV